MIRPTPRAAWFLAFGIVLALLPTLLSERWWPLWMAFVLLFGLACGIDALLVLPARLAELQVFPPTRLFVGTGEHLRLVLRAPGWRFPGELEVLVALEAPLEPADPIALSFSARAELEFSFPLVASRRGTGHVALLWLRAFGTLGLMSRTWTRALDLAIPVVPDIATVRQDALRFLGSRSAQAGIKIERYEGDGTEFDALRSFVPGFDVRSIDWKSSARHRRLMSRKFRAERNHQVILAFDTGRLMGERLGHLARLDHAIHAGLLLGYVGLRTGDRVGLCGFGPRLTTFVSPAAGVRAFANLLVRSSELEYGTDETNYTLSLVQLAAQLRRRSLVVVFSDFVDSVTADLMVDNLGRIGRRHLVLFVCSPDPNLQAARRARPEDLGALCKAVVATDVTRERQMVLARLRRAGVHVVDAPFERVSARLLGRYLEIRRRELV